MIKGCYRGHSAKGFCNMHYQIWKRSLESARHSVAYQNRLKERNMKLNVFKDGCKSCMHDVDDKCNVYGYILRERRPNYLYLCPSFKRKR